MVQKHHFMRLLRSFLPPAFLTAFWALCSAAASVRWSWRGRTVPGGLEHGGRAGKAGRRSQPSCWLSRHRCEASSWTTMRSENSGIMAQSDTANLEVLGSPFYDMRRKGETADACRISPDDSYVNFDGCNFQILYVSVSYQASVHLVINTFEHQGMINPS